MNVDIAALRAIERDKDIPFETVIEAIETALLLAASGLSVALGLGLALVSRTYGAAVLGFALVGFGVSNMVPILFRSAGRGGDSGAAIASVSIVGYFGFLVGPPLIGAFSQSVGLSTALSLVILFGLTIAAGARLVGGKTKSEIDLSKNPQERTIHVQCEPTL